MDLSTYIADYKFDNCLMNASGAKCTTQQELDDLVNSNFGALVTKSCTSKHRDGNPEPRYVEVPLGSINSMGLPNLGVNFYLNYVEEHQNQKPIFLSVAGLTLEENLLILQRLNQSKANFMVELNLSCPNIPGKPQTGYDFERTEEVLTEVFEFYNKPLGVKLPPYFDMVHFQEMAYILNQFPIKFVTSINSIGNGLYIDADLEQVVIKPKNGFGGLGGEYVKPTALANVRQFYTLLRDDIQIIASGGITSGRDVFEHILCGASMTQIGTQLMKEGVDVCDRISQELIDIMTSKGYNSINDFKGKLKSI